ncbi:MAG: NAD(P)-dependent oxidoreductase [Methanotrichaceae archaeon]|jgi:nucleoside-diphosphate-sugar epimerase
MKRVLVTGATGFIGRHCLPILSARGYEVHAVSMRSSFDGISDIHWHKVDLLNSSKLRDLVADVMPSHLLHFAWYAVPGKYWTSLENIRWVKSSLDLLQAFVANGGERAVMAGTCAEYDWRYGYCSEKITPLVPSTLYGTCKHSLQIILDSLSKQTGLSSAWGRIFFLYGPYEHQDRLTSSVIRSLLMGERARCSHGNQIRDFLYVRDAADAFVALLESDIEGPVNIGSGRPIVLRDIMQKISDKIIHRDNVEFGVVPVSIEDPFLLVADVRRLTKEVDWAPKYSLDQGLDETISWWRKIMEDDAPKE